MTTEPTPLLETKEKLRSRRSFPWLWLAVTGGLVSLGVGAYYALTTSNPSSPPPVATPTPTWRAISALGRIEPEGEVIRVVPSSALGSARVSQLLVKEGDRVQQGQVLARLDIYDRALAELLAAQSQVEEQQRRVEQIKAGAKQGDILAQERAIRANEANLQRLRSEYNITKVEFERYERLFKEGAVSASTFDSFRLRAVSLQQQIAQAEQLVQQARAQLSSIAEVRPTDVRLAESQLQTAIINVRRAEVNLELSQVRAPSSGQVLKIHSKAGENVNPTEGLLELGNTQQMMVVAEIYETDIGEVQVGQRAEIISPVFAQPLTGRVAQIGLRVAKKDILGTDPAARTDARVVEARIKLNESEKAAKLTNLQVQVRIFPK